MTELKNIKENNSKINDYIDIILLFPESISSESLTKEFILSKNDIRQSGFLAVLIDNFENNINENNTINGNQIKIPSDLYSGVRYIDLVLFIDLWKGKESLNCHILDDKIHNLKAIKQLCDALTLNEDLYFVKKLMNLYPYKE
jgi:hypothetical protein